MLCESHVSEWQKIENLENKKYLKMGVCYLSYEYLKGIF